MIAALVVIAFGLVYGLSSLQPKVYSATAAVKVDASNPALAGPTGRSTDVQIMANEVYLAQGSQMRQTFATSMGADEAKVLSVGITQVTSADVVGFTVTSHSPVVAARAANVYAGVYATIRASQLKTYYLGSASRAQAQAQVYEKDLANLSINPSTPNQAALAQERDVLSKAQGSSLADFTTFTEQAQRSGSVATVVRTAGPPKYPTSPTPLRDAGIAGAVALIFGIGLAFLLEQLDNRIKTPEDVARVTGGVPVLGSLPAFSDGRRHLFSRRFHRAERALVPPTSAAAESYFALATSLRFSNLGKEKRTILVTSSMGEEGKTTVTANLAAVLAESGFRVVVVSADLRRPMMGELLHSAETEKGLTSAMLGDRELASCFLSVPLPSGKNIFVLPTGPLPHEPAVLLGSDMFGTVLEQIKRSQADFILIDCAPVLPVSDPVAASRHVDGVLVLALHGETRRSDLAETIERLRQVDADIIGVVLNGVPHERGRFDYYGYYGYRPYQRQDDASSTNGSSNGSSNGAPAKATAASVPPSDAANESGSDAT